MAKKKAKVSAKEEQRQQLYDKQKELVAAIDKLKEECDEMGNKIDLFVEQSQSFFSFLNERSGVTFEHRVYYYDMFLKTLYIFAEWVAIKSGDSEWKVNPVKRTVFSNPFVEVEDRQVDRTSVVYISHIMDEIYSMTDKYKFDYDTDVFEPSFATYRNISASWEELALPLKTLRTRLIEGAVKVHQTSLKKIRIKETKKAAEERFGTIVMEGSPTRVNVYQNNNNQSTVEMDSITTIRVENIMKENVLAFFYDPPTNSSRAASITPFADFISSQDRSVSPLAFRRNATKKRVNSELVITPTSNEEHKRMEVADTSSSIDTAVAAEPISNEEHKRMEVADTSSSIDTAVAAEQLLALNEEVIVVSATQSEEDADMEVVETIQHDPTFKTPETFNTSTDVASTDVTTGESKNEVAGFTNSEVSMHLTLLESNKKQDVDEASETWSTTSASTNLIPTALEQQFLDKMDQNIMEQVQAQYDSESFIGEFLDQADSRCKLSLTQLFECIRKKTMEKHLKFQLFKAHLIPTMQSPIPSGKSKTKAYNTGHHNGSEHFRQSCLTVIQYLRNKLIVAHPNLLEELQQKKSVDDVLLTIIQKLETIHPYCCSSLIEFISTHLIPKAKKGEMVTRSHSPESLSKSGLVVLVLHYLETNNAYSTRNLLEDIDKLMQGSSSTKVKHNAEKRKRKRTTQSAGRISIQHDATVQKRAETSGDNSALEEFRGDDNPVLGETSGDNSALVELRGDDNPVLGETSGDNSALVELRGDDNPVHGGTMLKQGSLQRTMLKQNKISFDQFMKDFLTYGIANRDETIKLSTIFWNDNHVRNRTYVKILGDPEFIKLMTFKEQFQIGKLSKESFRAYCEHYIYKSYPLHLQVQKSDKYYGLIPALGFCSYLACYCALRRAQAKLQDSDIKTFRDFLPETEEEVEAFKRTIMEAVLNNPPNDRNIKFGLGKPMYALESLIDKVKNLDEKSWKTLRCSADYWGNDLMAHGLLFVLGDSDPCDALPFTSFMADPSDPESFCTVTHYLPRPRDMMPLFDENNDYLCLEEIEKIFSHNNNITFDEGHYFPLPWPVQKNGRLKLIERVKEDLMDALMGPVDGLSMKTIAEATKAAIRSQEPWQNTCHPPKKTTSSSSTAAATSSSSTAAATSSSSTAAATSSLVVELTLDPASVNKVREFRTNNKAPDTKEKIEELWKLFKLLSDNVNEKVY